MRKVENMKKTITVLSAFALATSISLFGSVGPANAASACVSQAEFGKIKNGMTIAKVKSLTGTNGTLTSAAGKGSYRVELRSYKACTKYGAVAISYIAGKVSAKSGLF